MTEKQETTPYDDVFRTQVTECPKLLFPVINEAFHENYTGKEEIIRTENENFLRQQNGQEEKRITDTALIIKKNKGERGKGYHLECQSTKDGTIAVRMYEYDSQIALKNGEMDGNSLIVRFPYSAILYLRADKKTKDYITMVIETSGGSVSYRIPLIKIRDYDIESIFQKHLFFLLPFRIFVYEDEMDELEGNEKKREQLMQEFMIIRERLQENCEKGIIDEFTKCTLIDMSKKVIRNLLKNKFPKVRKGVEEAMGGRVLDYEAKRIRDGGREEGRQIQLLEGICKKLRKGKDVCTIADELEEDINVIEKICEIAKEYAPQYDMEKIWGQMMKNKL